MGGLTRRVAKRQGDQALRRLGAQRLDSRGTGLVTKQAVEPVLQKAFLPAPNAGLGLGRSPHDRVRADAIGGQQHDFSPPDVLPRRVAVLHHSLEPANSGGRNGEGFFPARIAQTRTSSPHRESHPGLKCQVRSTRLVLEGVEDWVEFLDAAGEFIGFVELVSPCAIAAFDGSVICGDLGGRT